MMPNTQMSLQDLTARLRLTDLTRLLGLSALLLVVACAELQRAVPAYGQPNSEQSTPADVAGAPQSADDAVRVDNAVLVGPHEPDVQLGSGNFVKPASRSLPDSASDDRSVVMNFQGTDIHEVVKVVLGDLLNANYVIDPAVAGVVNTETSGGLRKEDLLPVLETLLDMNGASLIQDEDGLYRVVPQARTLSGATLPITTRGQVPGYGVQIVPLKFISVAEMQKILEPFVQEQNLVYVDERRNLLMLAGTQSERANLLQTIKVFDVDWMKGMSIGLFPLNYVEPKALIEELQAAIGGADGKILDGLVRLIPIERLNSLLVVTPRANALVETRNWIQRLDRTGTQAGPRLFVYKVQNAKAADLAGILNEIFLAEGGGSRAPQVRLAPGATASEISSAPNGNQPRPPASASNYSGESISMLTSDTIRIIADEVNNGLVVLATQQEYEIVEAAIKKLDIMPMQVLIEATIVEVTLNDTLKYGVEWFFKNNFGKKQGSGLLDLGSTGISAFSPAFSYAIVDGLGQVRTVLNALETASRIEILSSPSIMVLDNQTAIINVGDEIPIPTSQSTSNFDSNSPTVNQIQYRNTGVTLTVTPRVNAGGLVTMEVDQEVSVAAQTTSSELNAPTIQRRHINSVVAVHSGETVILGGLIRNTLSESDSGLPFLKNVPLLGKLFGQTTDSDRRTELLILITPRAIATKRDAREITQEFREKLNAIAPLEPITAQPTEAP